MEGSILEAAGGPEAILRLARAWHGRCLADPVVSHAFSHVGQHPDHTARLAAYWVDALGGEGGYPESHSHVLRLHSGNGEHREMDRRAIACFGQALEDAEIPEVARPALLAYFTWGTEAMAAHPDSPDDVPDGLPLPRWGWTGLA